MSHCNVIAWTIFLALGCCLRYVCAYNTCNESLASRITLAAYNEVSQWWSYRNSTANAFNHLAAAAGIATVDVNKAREIIEGIVETQGSSGIISESWFWGLNGSALSALVQEGGRKKHISSGEIGASGLVSPPMLAQVVAYWLDSSLHKLSANSDNSLYTQAQRDMRKDIIKKLGVFYDSIYEWHSFLMRERSVEIHGVFTSEGDRAALLTCIHPLETLVPENPAWVYFLNYTLSDEHPPQYDLYAQLETCLKAGKYSLKYAFEQCKFVVTPVSFNAAFVRSLEASLHLSSFIAHSDSKAQQTRRWLQQVVLGIRKILYFTSLEYFFDAKLTRLDESKRVEPTSFALASELIIGINIVGISSSVDISWGAGYHPVVESSIATMLSAHFLPGPFIPSLSRLNMAYNSSFGMFGPVHLRDNFILYRSFSELGMNGLASFVKASSQELICSDIQKRGFGVMSNVSNVPFVDRYDSKSGAAIFGQEGPFAASMVLMLFGSFAPAAEPGRAPVGLVGVTVSVGVTLLLVLLLGVGCIPIGIQSLKNVRSPNSIGYQTAEHSELSVVPPDNPMDVESKLSHIPAYMMEHESTQNDSHIRRNYQHSDNAGFWWSIWQRLFPHSG